MKFVQFQSISLKLINDCYNGVFIHKAPTALYKLKRLLNANQGAGTKVKNITARNMKIHFLALSGVCKMYPVSSKVYFSRDAVSYQSKCLPIKKLLHNLHFGTPF